MLKAIKKAVKKVSCIKNTKEANKKKKQKNKNQIYWYGSNIFSNLEESVGSTRSGENRKHKKKPKKDSKKRKYTKKEHKQTEYNYNSNESVSSKRKR